MLQLGQGEVTPGYDDDMSLASKAGLLDTNFLL